MTLEGLSPQGWPRRVSPPGVWIPLPLSFGDEVALVAHAFSNLAPYRVRRVRVVATSWNEISRIIKECFAALFG